MTMIADTSIHTAFDTTAAPETPRATDDIGAVGRRGQPVVTAIAATVLALGVAWLASVSGWRFAALWIVGALFGVALYHAAFGFTHGFRVLFTERRSAHVRAQMLLLGATVLLFYPLLAAGGVLGQPVRGFVFPAGLEVALGAFLFGVGMQLGGGCASGTLYTAGGGSTRMLVTLAAFIVGATVATVTWEHWHVLPSLPPIGAVQTLGLAPALAGTLTILGLVWWGAARAERARHGRVEPIFRLPTGPASWVKGPWPFAAAALAIAVLELATLLIAGRPWGITQAFALWGAHAVDRLGLDDPTFWAFWEEPTRADALLRPLAADITTVMDVGLIVGALLAAGLAGRFAPTLRVPLPHLLAAVVGGLLLGFGAIMATGCNISAYVSGIASGSLHGWLWIAAALPGNYVGTKLRPLFRLGA
ncbi:YeeE/YedE family protein [Rhodoplanes sp. SY1]|uniref:YeeE/YedE family protein n=1 Tax=Rhodoplanes sp. SY1 TaxID=3166646 RepID=UPI0038B64C98